MTINGTAESKSAIYNRLGITPAQLTTFCQQWHVAELSFFGAVLQANINTLDDIDVLISYLPTAQKGLFEQMRMKDELEKLLHCRVGLVSKTAIAQSNNWLRRKNILSSAEVFYVA